MRMSSVVTPSDESHTTIATSARSAARSERSCAYQSTVPATFVRRRSPAVSTRTTSRPSICTRVSIASRVVPACSETITRSSPRM